MTENLGNRFGKLPGYGKVLVGIAVFFLIVNIALYAWGSFGSTRIQSSTGSQRTSPAATYQWTGGTLVIDNPSTTHTGFCDVNGQRVPVPNQSKRTLSVHRYAEVGPGSGKVTCSGGDNTYFNARTGTTASVFKFSNSWTFRVVGGALVVVPIVAAFLIGAGRRRQRAS
ncbi:hypothetical protein FPZ12_030495 [Amycolatopsis acidicola]|uniref:Uncharacterized protein n=1 Tax=Amycolatopsis acidicola TaxID=2596893 RepID=A0A5N0UWC2_9PSEU|nr:hypothetical protein [Amycolatopsis acidicola]KAA9155172.1 hypothetical protein FPZ12_030495 [Amycolatopsis acidicola]